MSSRITRSSARQQLDLPAPTAEPPQPNTSSEKPTSRKRKAAARESTPPQEDQANVERSSRRSRRTKRAKTGQDPAEPSPYPSAGKRKAQATMSNAAGGKETPGEASTSPAAPSSSKRGKSSRVKKSSSLPDAVDSESKRQSSPKTPGNQDTMIGESKDVDAGEMNVDAMGDEEDMDDPLPEHDDEDDDDDEPMDDDPFESSFLGRHGHHSGISSTLRALSGMISGQNSRLRTLLENLRSRDQSIQLIALQELSEHLLISTEDNLAGHFSPDAYCKEFIRLMQPPEDGIENPEIMLYACRCVANMIEALPAATATVVYTGAVPVLVSKLLEIQYMDLAEQALITLEKISVEFPAAIVRDGGLSACLQYLDFFSTSLQRTAVTTAANCCRNVSEDSFNTVCDVMPILLNVLDGSDQKVVEQGCLCVSRIVESFKYQEGKLEELMSTELLKVILRLLLPGSTNLIGPSIHTQFLRVLSITARASPSLTVELFKMDVVDTLYQILTGVSPPSGLENVAQKIDSVVIMQALIHRPRDQVFETLNVVCELLPGLPKDCMNYLDDLLAHVGISQDVVLSRAKESKVEERLELLQNCKVQLKRFAVILLPTLTDAYSSTVNLSVRQKVLTAQLKMLSNLDVNILEDALRAVPYASFLASILSQQDHPLLVTGALQATELLVRRLDHVYRYQFYREGVIAEIRKLADRPLESTTSVTQPQGAAASSPPRLIHSELPDPPVEAGSAHEGQRHPDLEDEEGDDLDDGQDERSVSSDGSISPRPQMPMPPAATSQDIISKSTKSFIDKYENESGRAMREKARKILEELQNLISDISDSYEAGRTTDGAKLFARLAKFFEGDALESITSYELLTSKVVSTLLDIFEDPDGEAKNAARSAFLQVFMGSSMQGKVKTASSQSPQTLFSVLIHKLQDLLSRAEHFEVVTVHQNAFDSNRSSAASMLAKQIRIRLVGDDDSGIPRAFRKIMVSIHAIATFKALDDYLRPRISMAERPRSSRPHDSSSRSASAYAAGLADTDESEALSAMRTMLPPPIPGATWPNDEHAESGSRDQSRANPLERAATSVDSPTKASAGSSTFQAKRIRKPTTPPSKTAAFGDTAPSGEEPVNEDSTGGLECADETTLSEDHDHEQDEFDETAEGNADGELDTILGEFEEEVGDDEPDPNAVHMEIAASGKVTARQPDGTKVATPGEGTTPTKSSASTRPPAPPSGLGQSLLSSLTSRAMSYAAAVQTVPQDWHLEFSSDGKTIPNDTTIYRAIHFNQITPEGSSTRNTWSNVHSINFKRVPGPPSAEPSTLMPQAESSSTSSSVLPKSLDKNPITAAILRLLRILHEMNNNLDEAVGQTNAAIKVNAEPLTQFVNTKLTAKLNRQLEEPLIVASNCLPTWSEDLARLYPFLFPFETRHLFLQSTSFGYSRSMTRWQNAQATNDSRRDRHRDERPFLGRLMRQKVRISRHKILESAVKVMDLYGSSPSVLEVEYFEEVGTGLGPTLEFYSSVSKEFSKKKLKLWRENESNRNDEFAFGSRGLFPAPMSEEQSKSENGQKVIGLFKALGIFVARSMLDSRLIDVSFNPMFFRLNEESGSPSPPLSAVKAVDSDLANSLQALKQFATQKRKIQEEPRLTAAQKAQKTSKIQVSGAKIDDLGLDFTLPGYPDIELIPDGSNASVTIDNVGQYINKVVDYTLGRGVHRQISAFRTGFSQVFPYSALRAFTPDELVMLFGRVEEDWSMETLMDAVKADHGYNLDSKSVRNLLQAMSELTQTERRDFLQFVTGSPKLPIGGFKSLTPMFTVVCKPADAPYTSDDYLPSVMTCVNYLKLPDYSSLEAMKRKLGFAINEGQGAFHLS